MNLFVSLKYLVALDDHRHFGRAALACSVTQPALSNAIRALEASFGISIVKRGRTFAGFTVEGERILASGRKILREYELLQQDLLSSKDSPTGNLMVGAVPTAMPIASRFVAMLQARFPGITPTLRSLSSVELESGLESLSLDMALGYTERMDSAQAAVRVIPQYTEHYFLLRKAPAAKVDGLQRGAPITWREAAGLPLCLLSAEMHNRAIIDRAFGEAGVHPKPVIETNSISTLALSVRAGAVCSIMPGALVDDVQGYRDIEALPLVEPRVEIDIALLVHDTNRPSRTLEAALAFAEGPAWRKEVAGHAGALAGDA